jgi:recombination protein RecT
MTNDKLDRADRSPARTLEELLSQMQGAMAQALPRHMHPERMLRLATTAMRTNKQLAQCTPASFLGAVMQASIMGLEVNTPSGHAYLVPFKNKGVLECTLIIGYQGMMDLARRSGHVRSIYAFPVYVGDVFEYEFGLNPTLQHKPIGGDKADANLTHVYAVAKLDNGEPVFTVLTVDDVEYFRSKSKAANSPFWRDNYPQMAMKTAVRRLYTWLPRSSEMAVAQAVEQRGDDRANQIHATPEVVALLESQGVDVPADEPEDPPEPIPVAAPEQDGQRMKLGKKAQQTPPQPDEQPAQRMREPGED